MINMVMMPFVKVVADKALEILEVVFLIYLKNFLAVVLVGNQDKEGHKEEMIFVTICQFLLKKLTVVKNLKYEFQVMKAVTYVQQLEALIRLGQVLVQPVVAKEKSDQHKAFFQ